MEGIGTVASWMAEAIAGIPSRLSDPFFFGAVLAVVFLVALYSIVSSLRRLRRRLEDVAADLSAIRSALKALERASGGSGERNPRGDGEKRDIWTTVFRTDDDATDRR